MTYLLDSDLSTFVIHENPVVLSRLLSHQRKDVVISVIVEAELRAGAARSSFAIKARRKVDAFLSAFSSVEFTSADAIMYAHIRAEHERLGTPIGQFDALIAAQALAKKLILVTNNEREFKRVPGLRIENWTR